MLQLEVVPGARVEILEATQWMGDRSLELGEDLASEIHRVTLLLRRQPGLGSPMRGAADGIRKMVLRRFRYVLIYQVQGDVLQIISLMHTSRKPGYWAERIERAATKPTS